LINGSRVVVLYLRLSSGGPLTVPYAVTLLEYCLMSGMDWWDVLLALRPSMLDAVCERFSESFLRQPAAMQQFHYSQYLCIKTSLYRLVPALNSYPIISTVIPCYGINGYKNLNRKF
jgi:hypothetical protein